MKELITAVITTYKRKDTILKRAIQSVLDQTWRPIELVVVNDYPEDKVLADRLGSVIEKLAEEYQDVHIRYIVLEKNSGACAARNRGLALAEGAYISFLDDDDVWKPEKLEKQYAGFTSDNIGMVYSPFLNISYQDPNDQKVMQYGTSSGELLEELLAHNIVGGTSMVMLKTECLRAIGGFDTEMQSSQDYDVWIRIAEKYLIGFVPDVLTIRYLTEDSITTNTKKKENGWSRLTQKNWHYYQDRNDVFASRLIWILKYAASVGDFAFIESLRSKYKQYFTMKVYIVYYLSKAKYMLKYAFAQ